MINKITLLKFLSAEQWERIRGLIYKKQQLIPVCAEKKQPVIMKNKNDFLL